MLHVILASGIFYSRKCLCSWRDVSVLPFTSYICMLLHISRCTLSLCNGFSPTNAGKSYNFCPQHFPFHYVKGRDRRVRLDNHGVKFLPSPARPEPGTMLSLPPVLYINVPLKVVCSSDFHTSFTVVTSTMGSYLLASRLPCGKFLACFGPSSWPLISMLVK